MNVFTSVLDSTRLRTKSGHSDELATAYSVLVLAEALDAGDFTGRDFFSEAEVRLTSLGVARAVVQRLAQLWAHDKRQLNQNV